MSYIGQQPLNNFVTKQSQTFTPDGSTVSFTLNFAVTSGIDIMLVINNVVQEPGAGKAYTASGTTLTMSEAPGASDSMYCIFLGLALQTVNPGDASVGTSKLVDSAVTNAKIADSSVTSAKLSGVTQGITMADQWRLSASITGTNADITSNLERVDNTGWGGIGTGVTESSGIFSFPSTGVYLINVNASFFNPNSASGIDGLCNVDVYVTTDNSSYTKVARAYGGFDGTTNDRTSSGTTSFILDVTDISNVKIKFATSTLNADTALQGNTDENRTDFLFIRLGDT